MIDYIAGYHLGSYLRSRGLPYATEDEVYHFYEVAACLLEEYQKILDDDNKERHITED